VRPAVWYKHVLGVMVVCVPQAASVSTPAVALPKLRRALMAHVPGGDLG
jgi:hypothetical protein